MSEQCPRFASLEEFEEWSDGPFEDACDAAVADGDAEGLVRLYQELWARFPGDPASAQELQLVWGIGLTEMLEVGAWAGMRQLLPVWAQWYSPADPERRFFEGVVAWQTGEGDRGRQILADLHNEFGPSAFGKDPSYVAVATGAQSAAASQQGSARNGAAHSGDDSRSDADDADIQRLAEEVNEAMDEDRFDEAITRCREALALLPEPRTSDSGVWFYATMGDAMFGQRNWTGARDAFYEATQCPGGIENPFVQLRLGQSEYELGRQRPAANGLITAWMSAPEIFDDEPPQYQRFLRDQGLI